MKFDDARMAACMGSGANGKGTKGHTKCSRLYSRQRHPGIFHSRGKESASSGTTIEREEIDLGKLGYGVEPIGQERGYCSGTTSSSPYAATGETSL